MELLDFTFVFDDNDGFSFLSLFDLEGPMLHICLNDWIIEFPANKSLGIEDCVMGVFGCLIFGSISDKSFGLCKGDIRWSGSVALIVGYDLDSVVLPYPYTRVGCTKIDSDCF
jgi:hypothetical protein